MVSRRRSLPLLGLVAMAVLVGLAGCVHDDYTPVATMQAMPGAQLSPFPGAILLQEGAVPKSGKIDGNREGYLNRTFGLTAGAPPPVTQGAIIAWPRRPRRAERHRRSAQPVLSEVHQMRAS
jgi:hypothetical protein